jgi:ATP-dependent exoDNAse (exonuclease V) beta subunit
MSQFISCPYLYKLLYIDKSVDREKNVFSAFGSAIHKAADEIVKHRFTENPAEKTIDDWFSVFDAEFKYQMVAVEEYSPGFVQENLGNITKFRHQAKNILPNILPALDEYFENDWRLVSTEYKFQMPIDYFEDFTTDREFVGIVDLTLESPVGSGKLHILDWKTCSWGWKQEKKSDKMTNYQLAVYKYFMSRVMEVDLKDIEVHFGLLKRTAKKNVVEIFRTTAGPKRIDNVFNLVKNTIINIDKQNFPRNKLSCGNYRGCKWKGTLCQ